MTGKPLLTLINGQHKTDNVHSPISSGCNMSQFCVNSVPKNKDGKGVDTKDMYMPLNWDLEWNSLSSEGRAI